MLETLLGSANKERVLLFIYARNEGYPRQIATFYEQSLSPFQKQLEQLENGGVLVSRLVGKTRLYQFNPRYTFLHELKQLLEKALSFYPEELRDQLLMNRRRPRRSGKPL